MGPLDNCYAYLQLHHVMHQSFRPKFYKNSKPNITSNLAAVTLQPYIILDVHVHYVNIYPGKVEKKFNFLTVELKIFSTGVEYM